MVDTSPSPWSVVSTFRWVVGQKPLLDVVIHVPFKSLCGGAVVAIHVGGPDVVEVLLSKGGNGWRHVGHFQPNEFKGLLNMIWRTKKKCIDMLTNPDIR